MSKSLLPPSSTDLERAADLAMARVGDVPVPIGTLWDPQAIPETHLPYLAWALSVADEWQFARTDAERRALVAAAVELHRTKGTPHAVKRGMQLLGFAGAEIVEGLPAVLHNGEIRRQGSQPYAGASRWAMFRVVADLGSTEGLDAAQVARIVGIVNAYKNARSHLYALQFRANVTVAGRRATDAVGLRAGLRLRSGQGVRDGRYRRGSSALYRRDGALTYAGAVSRRDRIISAEIPFAVGHLWQRQRLHVGLQLTARRPPLLPRDGVLTFSGAARRGAPVAVIRTGGLLP